jgi:hypothetical protein
MGSALINSVGNLGGFIGPYAIGLIKQQTHSFAGGLAAGGIADPRTSHSKDAVARGVNRRVEARRQRNTQGVAGINGVEDAVVP